MKKFIFLAISLIMLTLVLFSCTVSDDGDDIDSSKYPELFQSSETEKESQIGEWKITLNGTEIEEASSTIYETYAEIPVLAILKEVGFDIEWQTETTATLKYESNVYFFDASALTIKKEGTKNNLLAKNYKVCRFLNKELIVDAALFNSFMNVIDMPIGLSLDYELSLVCINLK